MDRNSSNHKRVVENDSLGILCMDNLKAFGETSGNASMVAGGRQINDRLNVERMKALEAMKKFDTSRRSMKSFNKENIHLAPSSLNQTPSACEKSDFVPYRQPKSFNISDLVTDETINLEDSDPPNEESVKPSLSFEPNEMTGRSTLFKGKHDQRKKVSAKNVSVADILASSYAKKARDLSETLRSDVSRYTFGGAGEIRGSSTRSSCSSFSYNGLHSLPKTADLSVSKQSISDLSINGGEGFSFVSNQFEQSRMSEEKFAPSEVAMNKIVMDEIAWAQEFAAIPKATLSKQAKEKVNYNETKNNGNFDSSTMASFLMSDPNFSMGTFFNMRSEDICNIVKSNSPDKCRTPVALVDDSSAEYSGKSYSNFATDSEATPKVDNKTYTKIQGATLTKSKNPPENHESKDSGRESQNSFLLSMSLIDKALCDLNLETDASTVGVIQKVLSNAKRAKSPQPQMLVTDEDKSPKQASIKEIVEILSENKENVDPEMIRRATLSETLDFTDSLLNSSDMKRAQRVNSSMQRSPLSPLSSSNPQIVLAGGHEADVDEWPSTPVKPGHRKVKKTKSPYDQGPPKDLRAEADSTLFKSPQKTPVGRSERSKPKSMCSTRLEDAHTSADCDFGISPSLVQAKSPGITINCEAPKEATPKMMRKSSLAVGNIGKAPGLSSPTPYQNLSPMSSPRSGMSSPSISGYQSPHLDSTTNSEKRILNSGAPVVKSASSPAASESGNSNYGGHGSTRSYSSASIRNPNVVGRSISRCSNSSEFSHRDGKVIPLKVTTLELSWGSTKLRTEVKKTMQVKNISNKRLVVRLEVSGPGFQIANMQGSSLTLQSQECRSIVINFCPTVTGAAVGTLSFFSPLGTTTVNIPFLEIPLYGYGGHSTIIPLNICKGPVGAPFMPMGDVYDLANCLEKTFEILNRGPLLGFVSVTVDSLGLMMPRLSDAFEVTPTVMLIPPGKTVKVKITFKPRREDIKKIFKKIQHVLTLANIRIICGDEANRQRVRRLLQFMTPEERLKISSSTLDKLWCPFPMETEIQEFDDFKEKPEVIMDLITCMRNHEIALTINRENMDDTIESSSLFYPDGDDTVLFRTICAASPVPQGNSLEPVEEALESTMHEGIHANGSSNETGWSVEPNILFLDIKGKNPVITTPYKLLIRNTYKSRQYFEVSCNKKNIFAITPSEGYVAPDGGQAEIQVRIVNDFRLYQEHCKNEDIFLTVNIENEYINVPIKDLK